MKNLFKRFIRALDQAFCGNCSPILNIKTVKTGVSGYEKLPKNQFKLLQHTFTGYFIRVPTFLQWIKETIEANTDTESDSLPENWDSMPPGLREVGSLAVFKRQSRAGFLDGYGAF